MLGKVVPEVIGLDVPLGALGGLLVVVLAFDVVLGFFELRESCLEEGSLLQVAIIKVIIL